MPCLLCLLHWSTVFASTAVIIPSFTQVKAQHLNSDQLLFDRRGVLLQQTRVNWQQRQGRWLPIEQMSPALIRMLLHAEDRRFYEHNGVDWYAVAGTAWSSMWGQRLRGTSTISMQLVDLLGLGQGRVAGRRSLSAKWQQARLAQRLEAQWSKVQIVEAYLNLVPFKGELVGADAMARVLWQKQAFALSLPEAALAVAMLPSPNASNAVLQQRSCLLWQGVTLQVDCSAQHWRNQQALMRLAQPAWGNPNLAPHAARFMQSQRTEVELRSSLDQVVQQQAQTIMQRHLADLSGVPRHSESNVNDGAVLVVENATGAIVAYVGSSKQSAAAQFDHVQAKRQAGSTLKPFLYQLALAQQRITAVSLLADTAAQFSTPYGVYVPQNYDEQFMGWVSARVALAGSINIPAVRLLAQIGVDDFQHYLQQLGFDLPYNADYYGLGLALGGVEVSLWQLTNAYRSLANLGVFGPMCLDVNCTTSSQRVAPEAASWITQDILADNTARAVTFGLDSALNTPFRTAVKTGTSKDMRDNWTVGFSQHYTVGVWVGNTDGSAMRDVSGVSGAGPIWHDVMRFLHAPSALSRRSATAAIPERVRCQMVIFIDQTEPTRQDCFISGTERTTVRLLADSTAKARILAPVDQAIYAIDPDIPAAQQRIVIRANASVEQAVIWKINGEFITDKFEFAWPLQAGRYHIELFQGATGCVMDSIYIDVKP